MNDTILQVDDIYLNIETYSDAAEAIKGEEGTTVKLVVLRGEEVFELEVPRQKITENNVTTEIIDEEFVVHDIKVIEGEKGLFIAMPSRKATDGEYRDIAHPINSATRERIQNIILEKYEQVLAEEPLEESVE